MPGPADVPWRHRFRYSEPRMHQATCRHYPSFTRRYVRSLMKMMELPKKPRIEAEIFAEMVHDEQVA